MTALAPSLLHPRRLPIMRQRLVAPEDNLPRDRVPVDLPAVFEQHLLIPHLSIYVEAQLVAVDLPILDRRLLPVPRRIRARQLLPLPLELHVNFRLLPIPRFVIPL